VVACFIRTPRKALEGLKAECTYKPRQSANYVAMDVWKQRLAEMQQEPDPHSTLQGSMRFLFLVYACSMPVKRCEVGSVQIFQTEPSTQELAKALMRITRHKTSKHEAHRGGIEEQLSEEFMAVLRDSLKRWPRESMFIDTKGQAYTNKGFSKWVRRTTAHLFGDRAPGINLLRHSYCTSLDYNSLTGAQRDAIALRCGHSARQQDLYRYLTLEPVKY
jgi:site-specific recombinase XerD